MSARHESAAALLRERGADDVAHPGGTLLAHLVRVHDRLLGLCGDEVLAVAGLTHAVYGTDGFGTSLLSLHERHVLAQAVGTEVEELVYLYGACDRDGSWSGLRQSAGAVRDRWTGDVLIPPLRDLARFVDLSTVNELDVMEQAPELRALHGPALLALFRTWRGLGSECVLAEAEKVLAGGT